MMALGKIKTTLIVALAFLLLPLFAQAEGLIAEQSFKGDNKIIVTFSGKVDRAVAEDVSNYTVFEEPDPDIRLAVSSVSLAEDGITASLLFDDGLNTAQTHVVSIKGLAGIEKTTFTVSKSYLGYLFGIFISALLINNFVFTKYLGLCVFFGTSKKKETAKGMGVVFTLVTGV